MTPGLPQAAPWGLRRAGARGGLPRAGPARRQTARSQRLTWAHGEPGGCRGREGCCPRMPLDPATSVTTLPAAPWRASTTVSRQCLTCWVEVSDRAAARRPSRRARAALTRTGVVAHSSVMFPVRRYEHSTSANRFQKSTISFVHTRQATIGRSDRYNGCRTWGLSAVLCRM